MEEKSLYICSLEARMVDYDVSGCYSIQAIDLTEVLSFSSTPIAISFDRSRQPTKKAAQDELREVDSLRGDSVPYRMSFGVFGSQIVLSCGFDIRERCSSDVYVLETNPKLPRGKKLSIIKAKAGKSKAKGSHDDFNIPPLNSPKGLVKLMEIQGKLYALDLEHHQVPSYTSPYVFFEVFDSKIGLWSSLPDPPRQILKTKEPLSCLVVGTKILVSSSIRTPVFYYFDVAEPTRPWRSSGKTRLGSDAFDKMPLNEPLVVDLEEDNCKLLLSHYMESIYVFQIKLSDPVFLDYVATIEVATGFEPFSSTITHLGGLKVCFVSGGISAYGKVAGVIFTFEISRSNSATSSTTPSSSCCHDDDSYFRIIYPDIRSNGTSSFFSAKSLGWRTFQYSWQREDGFPLYAPVIGLAVLPLHHRDDHASCRRCQKHFGNTKELKYHLSINESCRDEEQPQVQCKFCGSYIPKKELVSHFQTSATCKSKFTGII